MKQRTIRPARSHLLPAPIQRCDFHLNCPVVKTPPICYYISCLLYLYSQFFILSGVVSIVTCAVFLRMSSLLKLTILLLVVAVYTYFIEVSFHMLYVHQPEQKQLSRWVSIINLCVYHYLEILLKKHFHTNFYLHFILSRSHYLRRKGVSIMLIAMFIIAVFYNGRRVWIFQVFFLFSFSRVANFHAFGVRHAFRLCLMLSRCRSKSHPKLKKLTGCAARLAYDIENRKSNSKDVLSSRSLGILMPYTIWSA